MNRFERWAAGCYIVAVFGVPLLVGEWFPFSAAPMFRDAPTCYCEYEVRNPSGAAFALEDFGLHRVYWGNPPGGCGFAPRSTVDEFGEVASEAAVHAAVQAGLSKYKYTYVDVTQRVIGPSSNGAVGIVREKTWRISRAE